tara:strand:+ start:256 stop:393 length:138 start_codon:yes stop_codon:yes gene_type:complete
MRWILRITPGVRQEIAAGIWPFAVSIMGKTGGFDQRCQNFWEIVG